jgi:hypothetical protein
MAWNAAGFIWRRFSINRDDARAHYRKEYGVGDDDPSIEERIGRALDQHGGGDKIELPVELVLALMLRPRGTGRGNPGTETEAQRLQQLAIRRANEKWRELVDANPRTQTSKWRWKAAEQIFPPFALNGVPNIEWLNRRMTLGRRTKKNK